MPAEWKQLRVGMSRQQVIAVLPDPITDLRDLKGYDHVSRMSTVFGGRYHWTLTISYDEAGYLSEACASTGNEWTGLLDQRIWKIGD
jgi:outer membrane protein assembly factor BamE (lipoprotein component of BamABCDE complex)